MKRISTKPKKCPNPLFYKWITEWKNEAKEKGSEKRHVYAKALVSLSKYPLVLKTGRECGILQNFGVKICGMLDKKLEEYEKSRGKGESNHNQGAIVNRIVQISPIKKNKKTKSTKSNYSPKTTNEEDVIYELEDFHIQLIVDSGETSGFKGRIDAAKKSRKDQILSYLSSTGVSYEVRKLSVGDFVWACIPNRRNSSDSSSTKMDEKILVLPFVVERKRVDDFASSIRDGRFHEQKFRLKQSGMWQLIYLVEGISDKLGLAEKTNVRGLSLPVSTIQQASANTEVVDRFVVKDTKGQKESAEYLSLLTKCFVDIFQKKVLRRCKKNYLPDFSVNDDILHLMSLSEFNKSSVKCKDLTVSQMFIRHLLQIKGLSVEKAVAIVENYPTPADLFKAYEEDSASKQNLLAKITYGPNNRQIGPTLSKVICDLYTNEVLR